MHIWNLRGSVPPTRLRTTALGCPYTYWFVLHGNNCTRFTENYCDFAIWFSAMQQVHVKHIGFYVLAKLHQFVVKPSVIYNSYMFGHPKLSRYFDNNIGGLIYKLQTRDGISEWVPSIHHPWLNKCRASCHNNSLPPFLISLHKVPSNEKCLKYYLSAAVTNPQII